jgi:hypothetical protein
MSVIRTAALCGYELSPAISRSKEMQMNHCAYPRIMSLIEIFFRRCGSR